MEQDLGAEVASLRAELDTLARDVRPLLDQREEVRPAHTTGDASAGSRPGLAWRARLGIGGLVVVGMLIGYGIGLLQPRAAPPERDWVVVSSRDIPEGTVIEPHHITLSYYDRRSIPIDRLVQPQLAVGMRATAELKQGHIVRHADVARPRGPDQP